VYVWIHLEGVGGVYGDWDSLVECGSVGGALWGGVGGSEQLLQLAHKELAGWPDV